jgi:hypothetical protein
MPNGLSRVQVSCAMPNPRRSGGLVQRLNTDDRGIRLLVWANPNEDAEPRFEHRSSPPKAPWDCASASPGHSPRVSEQGAPDDVFDDAGEEPLFFDDNDAAFPAHDLNLEAGVPPGPVVELLRVPTTAEEWLRDFFAAAASDDVLKVVEVTESLLMRVLCLKYQLVASGQHISGLAAAAAAAPAASHISRLSPFAWLSIQRVLFLDGPVLFSTCNNTGCEHIEQ